MDQPGREMRLFTKGVAHLSPTRIPGEPRIRETRVGTDGVASHPHENMAINFESVARYLLNRCLLVCEGQQYFRICEIEVYLTSSDHPDPYTHCTWEQLTTGQWYWHRASSSNGSGYRGGTFKGVDLTYGQDINGVKSYGGILLRSIFDFHNNRMIAGPCLTVDRLLQCYQVATVGELVASGRQPQLIELPEPMVTPVYSGPRVGLTKTCDPVRSYFAVQPYRFVIYPHLIKKQKRTLRSLPSPP